MSDVDILPLGKNASSIETWRAPRVATVHVGAAPAPKKAAISDASTTPPPQDKGPSKEQVRPQEVIQGLGLQLNFTDIPDKLEFKIGEVAELLDVKPYVLRFWETEFDALRPEKAKNNQRVYSKADVELALLVKHLLYVEKYSIEGARFALTKAKKMAKTTEKVQALVQGGQEAKERLKEMLSAIRAFRSEVDSF